MISSRRKMVNNVHRIVDYINENVQQAIREDKKRVVLQFDNSKAHRWCMTLKHVEIAFVGYHRATAFQTSVSIEYANMNHIGRFRKRKSRMITSVTLRIKW